VARVVFYFLPKKKFSSVLFFCPQRFPRTFVVFFLPATLPANPFILFFLLPATLPVFSIFIFFLPARDAFRSLFFSGVSPDGAEFSRIV
jgi:hypothetical protein